METVLDSNGWQSLYHSMLVLNSNVAQAYLKVEESYQALHYATAGRKLLVKLRDLLNEESFLAQ